MPELPRVLFHHTTWCGFQGIVTERKFRATAHRRMNDPAELRTAEDTIRRVAEEVKQFAPPLSEKLMRRFLMDYPGSKVSELVIAYLACFSGARDTPSQWKKYGDEGRGVCVGIKVLEEEKVDESWIPGVRRAYVRVIYSESEWRALVEERFRSIAEAYVSFVKRHPYEFKDRWAIIKCWIALSRIAATARICAKGSEWSDEEEWRHVAVVRAGRKPFPQRRLKSGNPVDYLELPLRAEGRPLALAEVILGPRQEQGREAAMEEARSILKAAGYPSEYAELPAILCSEVSLTEASHAV